VIDPVVECFISAICKQHQTTYLMARLGPIMAIPPLEIPYKGRSEE